MAKLERSPDPDQVVPVLGDETDLGVVAEQGPGLGPLLVVAGGVGPPELFLGELGDAGREAEADEVEQGEGGQGLAVAVGGVL